MTAAPFTGDLISVRQAISRGEDCLRDVADAPRLEARLLLAHVLGLSITDLIADPDRVLNPKAFSELLIRRMTHEPIAYLLGKREFWSLDMLVSPATLIPRPETETIIEAALAAVPMPLNVLDLGTGSGCLLIAILHERPLTFGIGLDRSFDALAVAHRNATRYGLAARTCFIQGDWATAISGTFDLIVANPPYIPRRAIPLLMPEVARHEPRAALDGGEDGLTAYRNLVPDLPRLLTPTGHAVLEVGAGQGPVVAAIAQGHGLHTAIRSDLAGVGRAVVMSLSST